MKNAMVVIFSLFFVLAGFGLSRAADLNVKGSKDHPLLTRMPDFYISGYKDTEFFDTGKSEIKPESDAAISEIAKLLKNNDALKLYVVGHTDNVGSFDSNMQLSKDRADAVAKALSDKHGIAAARLKPYGVASLAPVTSNDIVDGKAKNRRVELVKQ